MGILNEANGWFDRSACRPVLEEGGIDYWYAEIGERGYFPSEKSIEAKIVCNSCPVRVNCLAYAMERELSYVMDERPKTRQEEADGPPEGIWAGYLPDQRVKLAKRLTGLTPEHRAAVYRRIGTRPIHMSERALRNRAARRRAERKRNAA